MTEPRKLHRDTRNAMLGGVASGTAEYLGIDVTACRVLWVVLLIVTGFLPMPVIYAAMWVLVPPKPQSLPAAGTPPLQQS